MEEKTIPTAEIEVIRLQELLTKEVVYEYFRTKYEEDNTYIPDDVRRMFKLMNNMGSPSSPGRPGAEKRPPVPGSGRPRTRLSARHRNTPAPGKRAAWPPRRYTGPAGSSPPPHTAAAAATAWKRESRPARPRGIPFPGQGGRRPPGRFPSCPLENRRARAGTGPAGLPDGQSAARNHPFLSVPFQRVIGAMRRRRPKSPLLGRNKAVSAARPLTAPGCRCIFPGPWRDDRRASPCAVPRYPDRSPG